MGNRSPDHERRKPDRLQIQSTRQVRGVIFPPAQVDTVLAEVGGAGPEFQAHIERGDDGREALTIRIEADDRPGLAEEQRQRLSDRIGVRVDVELLPTGALPRSA